MSLSDEVVGKAVTALTVFFVVVEAPLCEERQTFEKWFRLPHALHAFPLAGQPLGHEYELCGIEDVKDILSRCDNMVATEEVPQLLSSEVVKKVEDLSRRHSILHQNISTWADALPTELKWRINRRFLRDIHLDAHSAHPRLYLSLDRKSVRFGDVWHQVKETPQRYDTWNALVGMEQLTSGRHYWEVEVGDGKIWSLGVCDESVDRRGLLMRSPKNGYWEVGRYNEDYWALTFPPPGTRLNPTVRPRTVGVYVNYDSGSVTFYNVEGRTELFVFPEFPFSCTLRPSFCTGNRDPPMRIRALEEQE
ncbi:hypothetical protein NDU88_005106 [Pleurodeles waltl]|uniref:B30.2/SPRY domain-containing protein n=1 Tax=Pleurodeles waltl TaxID=8319 RepID=A0AAV7NLJ4_PLEWA|nr:hypothetical protein NDU88_005106 [Pleurodeles waltl]